MNNLENEAVPNPIAEAPALGENVENTAEVVDEAAEAEVAGCRSCGKPEIEAGYRFSLCAECRNTMARRPLPRWIIATTALVGCVLAVAFLLFPASLSAGVAFERGQRAEASHNYREAMTQYEKVVRRFPNSTPALGRLCVAAFRAGQYDLAAAAVDRLEGRKTSEKLADEINPIVEQLSDIFKKAEKQGYLKLGDGTTIDMHPPAASGKAPEGAKP